VELDVDQVEDFELLPLALAVVVVVVTRSPSERPLPVFGRSHDGSPCGLVTQRSVCNTFSFTR
jgi:hypothetical protein